jgi:hypothetical protein
MSKNTLLKLFSCFGVCGKISESIHEKYREKERIPREYLDCELYESTWGINIVGVLQRFNLSWNEVETFRECGGYFVVDVKEGNELPKDLDWIKFRYWNGILLEIEEL